MWIAKFARALFIDKSLVRSIEFLRQVALFEGLADRPLAELINIASAKSYVPDEVVYEENSAGRILYIVRSGRVAVLKDGHVLFTLSAGDYFGETALLEEAPRPVTVKASGQCELLLIYKVKFDGFLANDPAAGVSILRQLALKAYARLRTMDGSYAG